MSTQYNYLYINKILNFILLFEVQNGKTLTNGYPYGQFAIFQNAIIVL